MDCPTCQGNGELECPRCDSMAGNMQAGECPGCDGLEYTPCSRCSGTGYLEQYA